MAMDMFMKIDTLKGESVDKTHAGEIDVLAWSWGVSNSGSAHVGGGAGAGKANVQDLSFTKYVDKSTPDLMLASCNGKHYGSALLTVRKAGEKPLEYLKITMTEVLITSVSTGTTGGIPYCLVNLLVKPFTPDQLFTCVRGLVEARGEAPDA